MMQQKARGVLSLVSIPSTPVTVVSLMLGYASMAGTIFEPEVIDLIVAGALGHWAFYGLNDVIDYEWDKRQGRENKPLVRGDISLFTASIMCSVLGIGSVIYALYSFTRIVFLFWLAACLFGLIYDYRSKEDVYSGVYLSFWGTSVIYTGGLHAGKGVGGTMVILAFMFGVHMFWMTIMGNLKDVGQGEVSIPERLDCKIIDDNGYKHLWTSMRFNLASEITVLTHIVFLLLLPIGDGLHASDTVFIYIAIIWSVVMLMRFEEVLYQPNFSEDSMKKDIAIFEVVSVMAILTVSISYTDMLSVSSMVLLSIAWGLVWQTVLYGHPLRFP